MEEKVFVFVVGVHGCILYQFAYFNYRSNECGIKAKAFNDFETVNFVVSGLKCGELQAINYNSKDTDKDYLHDQ